MIVTRRSGACSPSNDGPVHDWRLLGECRAFDRNAPVPDELRRLLRDNAALDEPHVILHDPAIPTGHNWLRPYESLTESPIRFVLWFTRDRPKQQLPVPAAEPEMVRVYVPTPLGTGFRSESPLYEGHWRAKPGDEHDLPWPVPSPGWIERATFLEHLDHLEAVSVRQAYRGASRCRLCGRLNGHEALRLDRWEWPAGFRHYVADHAVQPSTAFEAFVRSRSRRG